MAKKSQTKKKRRSWLDEKNMPKIDGYAKKAKSFLAAAADGVIDDGELAAQEKRLVQLMKEVEPRLDDDLHEKVTELLCELTVYDLMHIMHAMYQNKPQTVFRG